MPTTKTIDERIRAKEEARWRYEVENIFEPVYRLLQIGHALETKINKESAHNLLDEVRRVITEYYLPLKQEQAVEKFLEKVEALHKQVGELRGEYQEE